MNQIEKARRKRHWSRLKLQNESGVSHVVIYYLERRRYKAKQCTVKKIADALDMDIEELRNFVK